MASKITYSNKEAIQNDASVPEKNKVTDANMNEIKEVVNENSDELAEASTNISKAVMKASGIFVTTSNYSENLSDANNAQSGLNYFIHHGITEEMVANLPEYGKFANLVTFHYSRSNNHGKFQLFVTEDSFYWRDEQGEGQTQGWNAWNKVLKSTDLNDLNNNMNNSVIKSSQIYITPDNYSTYFDNVNNVQNGLIYLIHHGITEEMISNLPEYRKLWSFNYFSLFKKQ